MRTLHPDEAEARCRAMHPTRDIHCTKYISSDRDHDGDHEGALETWPRRTIENYRVEKLFGSNMQTLGWTTAVGGISETAPESHSGPVT